MIDAFVSGLEIGMILGAIIFIILLVTKSSLLGFAKEDDGINVEESVYKDEDENEE